MQVHTLSFITLFGKRSPRGAGVIVPYKSVEGRAVVEVEVNVAVEEAEGK